jgi:hypothetical protein
LGRFSSTFGGVGSGFASFSAGRFSSTFGASGATSGFTILSTGFSPGFGVASGLLSFSTAGGFSPDFGALAGNVGAGCPVIGGFSFVSGATFPVGGVISADFPAALAGTTPLPLNSPARAVAAIAGLPRFVDTNCSLLIPAARA